MWKLCLVLMMAFMLWGTMGAGCAPDQKIVIDSVKTELAADMRSVMKEELNKIPNTSTEAFKPLVQMVADQGVLKDFMAAALANYQDPNIAITHTTIEKWGVGFDGINGRVDFSTKGVGTELPAALRQELIDELKDPRLPDAQRQAILDILGWNRAQIDAKMKAP
jgi:hypothetical protein